MTLILRRLLASSTFAISGTLHGLANKLQNMIDNNKVSSEEEQELQLKPIFEHLRQLKLKDKKDFSENLFTLTRTLKTRSESAKQALENDRLEISKNV